MRKSEVDGQHVPWDIKSHPSYGAYLSSASSRALDQLLERGDQERLAFLCDTRAVHKDLFLPLTPDGYASYAGTYRGEKKSILETRRTAIYYKNVEGLKERNPALHPSQVPEYMERLSEFITETFEKAPDMEAPAYLSRMSKVFGTFSKIHPYLDGNGHISRLMMVVLAKRRGISVSPNWTVHPRPYGLEISIALEHYKNCPLLLEQCLKLWFTPGKDQSFR